MRPTTPTTPGCGNAPTAACERAGFGDFHPWRRCSPTNSVAGSNATSVGRPRSPSNPRATGCSLPPDSSPIPPARPRSHSPCHPANAAGGRTSGKRSSALSPTAMQSKTAQPSPADLNSFRIVPAWGDSRKLGFSPRFRQANDRVSVADRWLLCRCGDFRKLSQAGTTQRGRPRPQEYPNWPTSRRTKASALRHPPKYASRTFGSARSVAAWSARMMRPVSST